jgi:hypothetical protein
MFRPCSVCLRFVLVLIVVGLPLGRGAAHVPPTRTPVTGQLATGGRFQGQLTIHALEVAPTGHLTARASVAGTATIAPGAVTPVRAQTVTARVTPIDQRGPCQMVLVQPHPLVLPRLGHPVTFDPVLVGLRTTATPGAGGPTTLCPMPPLHE